MKIQIIGKVNGIERSKAIEKFRKTKQDLEKQGHQVWNPMDNVPLGISRGDEMKICIRALLEQDAIYVQPDWWNSEGAKVEYMVAHAIGLKMIRQ